MQDSDAGRLLHLCGELDPFVGWVRSARQPATVRTWSVVIRHDDIGNKQHLTDIPEECSACGAGRQDLHHYCFDWSTRRVTGWPGCAGAPAGDVSDAEPKVAGSGCADLRKVGSCSRGSNASDGAFGGRPQSEGGYYISATVWCTYAMRLRYLCRFDARIGV